MPTDLSTYDEDQILRVKTPAPGAWYRINQITEHGHAVRLNTAIETGTGGVTDLGVSLVGDDTYGSVATVEGTDLDVTDSPVLRVAFNVNGANYTLQVLLRKSVLEGADLTRTPIYMAVYSATPSETTFLDVIPINKKALDVTEDGVVSQDYTATINQSRYNTIKAEHDADAEVYVEFYETFTTYANRGSVFDVLDEKEAIEIDPQPAVWARQGQDVPTGTINFDADEADTNKALDLPVRETTPPMSGGNPVASPSDITFVTHQQGFWWKTRGYFLPPNAEPFGSSSINPPLNSFWYLLFFTENSAFNYHLRFYNTFVKTKTPIILEIDGSSYNLSYNSVDGFDREDGGYIAYQSTLIPSNDRVSATDLTKAINIELVENEQVTFNDLKFSIWYENRNSRCW